MATKISPGVGLNFGYVTGEDGWGDEVNANWMLLDAVTVPFVKSGTVTVPPTNALEGDRYLIPSGATSVWSTQAGNIAIWYQGKWLYFTPLTGWYQRAWDTRTTYVFDGAAWVVFMDSVTPETMSQINAALAAAVSSGEDALATAGDRSATRIDMLAAQSARDGAVVAQGVTATDRGLAQIARAGAVTAQGIAEAAQVAALDSAETAFYAAGSATTKEGQAAISRQAAAASAAEALGYLNVYRTTSYGPLAADPTVDPLGNAPTTGDEYFSTSESVLKRYNGTEWLGADLNTQNLAASGGAALVGYLPAGTGAVATTVQGKLRESVSVKDFGAVGNGSTDDTAAIQAALNSNNGSIAVYFPRGVYRITSTILIPQSRANKMTGDGFNPQEVANPVEGTVIKWAGAANGLMFSSNIAGGANTSGLTIRDMRFDGDNIASRGMVLGADSAHPQHEYFENVQFRNFAFNGTDACLDLAGASYSKYGVADSTFINVLIDGGARALRISSQQLNFYGGAIGAKNGSVLVELGDNSHPKFYGTGFYSGPGNPISVFGVAGTVGIDGLECYGCWNEGQQSLFKRIGGVVSPAVGALRVIFHGQRSACVSSGTRVIDLTGLSSNLIWEGGYNDNLGQPAVYLETASTMTVYQLQSGGFTYTGTGTVTEYRSNGVKRWLGVGVADELEFNTSIGISGRNSIGAMAGLLRLNSDDLCVLGDDSRGTPTKLAVGPSANFPGGAAKYNGIVGVDSTNIWLVYYVNGQRFRVVGTAY